MNKYLRKLLNGDNPKWYHKITDPVLDLLYDIKVYIVTFFTNIKRVIDYLPLIWNDRDWDHYFLISLMQFKLKRMKYYFDNHGIADMTENNELKALDFIIKIGDRYSSADDEENSHFYKLHNKKWGELDIKSKDAGEGLSELIFSRPNANTEEEKEQERKEFLESTKVDERRRQRLKKYYFSALDKYVEYFWD